MTRPRNPTDHDLERRLSEVESLLTFLQKTTDDLNAVILEQQRRLDAQARELARLQATIETLTGSIVEAPRRPEDEKPPHY
jgi:SlyX protein